MEVALSYFHWLFLGNMRTTPAFFFPNSWVIQQGLGDVSRGTFPGLATGVRDIVRIPTASPSSHGSHYFIRAPLIISLIIIIEGQERQQSWKTHEPRDWSQTCSKYPLCPTIPTGPQPCIPRGWMGTATSPSQTQQPRKTWN